MNPADLTNAPLNAVTPGFASPAAPAALPTAAAADPAARFQQVLAGLKPDARQPVTDETADRVREAAQGLVASAFVLPILESVRDAMQENDPFYGGTTENLFGARLDTMLAEQIVGSSRMPLVDGIYRQIMSGFARPEVDARA